MREYTSIDLPVDLFADLTDIAIKRGIEPSELVAIYVRAFVRQAGRYAPLTPSSKMPFGKFRDEPVENVIKVDPGYIKWCLTNMDDFTLDEEAQELLLDTILSDSDRELD